jgi:hypothetical protein
LRLDEVVMLGVLRTTDQCSHGKTRGDAGHRAGAHIACDAADRRECAEDVGYIFVTLRARVREGVRSGRGERRGTRGTRAKLADIEMFSIDGSYGGLLRGNPGLPW